MTHRTGGHGDNGPGPDFRFPWGGATPAMADEFSANRNQTGAPHPDHPSARAGDRATGLSPAVWATGLILIAVVLLVVFGT